MLNNSTESELLSTKYVCFSAPIVWNELSELVRTSATRDMFSGRLKTELFVRGSWVTPKSVSLSDSIVIFIILDLSTMSR